MSFIHPEGEQHSIFLIIFPCLLKIFILDKNAPRLNGQAYFPFRRFLVILSLNGKYSTHDVFFPFWRFFSFLSSFEVIALNCRLPTYLLLNLLTNNEMERHVTDCGGLEIVATMTDAVSQAITNWATVAELC